MPVSSKQTHLNSLFQCSTDFHHETPNPTCRCREDQIERRATELLEQHPHFRGRSDLVQFRCTGNILRLGGCLPSYYLKQLAQEAIRGLEQLQIQNEILVRGMLDISKMEVVVSQENLSKRKPR